MDGKRRSIEDAIACGWLSGLRQPMVSVGNRLNVSAGHWGLTFPPFGCYEHRAPFIPNDSRYVCAFAKVAKRQRTNSHLRAWVGKAPRQLELGTVCKQVSEPPHGAGSPFHEHLFARSLERTVWEDQSGDVGEGGYPFPRWRFLRPLSVLCPIFPSASPRSPVASDSPEPEGGVPDHGRS